MRRTRFSLWGALAVGAIAAAAVVAAPAAPALADNIDPGTPTSLTIHKYAGSEGGEGDGSEIADPSGLGTPLAGVEFTITPVTASASGPIDLATPAGWERASNLTPADVSGGGFTLGTPTIVTTGADGSIASALPIGLYLVEETDPGENNVVSPVDPFLVTLPTPAGGGEWTYDVHVYPKNQLNATAPQKTVSAPDGFVLGAPVTWTIGAPVPALNQGAAYTDFTIIDPLDARLGFVSATIRTPGFTPGTDYTVTNTADTVTIALTATGRAQLVAGAIITVDIVTEVESLGGDGVVTNQATVRTNGAPVLTGTASTNWGALQILKHVSGDQTDTLADAEFAVFSDAEATDEIGTLTTDDTGTAEISLWAGNDATSERSYWVRETVAPAGFILDPQLREVVVPAGGAAEPTVLAVPNAQRTGPDLPLTGAQGQLWLSVAGVAVLAAAVGAALVVARKRRQQH
ncbi:SpaH/EbpB family LPXTG-anchored major pilin [Leucobacter sp. USCH14]|uniref:SpaH/EbpB family LPXTG-anchored major pilin n=1 Tax=Leucobacter sp. USCH14 TaxID=3024838 RepID=UPI0030A9C977